MQTAHDSYVTKGKRTENQKIFDGITAITLFDKVTPARTLSLSGLKSRTEIDNFDLKMMMKSGIDFFFEIHKAPLELLLPVQKKSAQKG